MTVLQTALHDLAGAAGLTIVLITLLIIVYLYSPNEDRRIRAVEVLRMLLRSRGQDDGSHDDPTNDAS
ncbi:hypothetical protein [Jatrophihabitans sp.]|uniref:hypothetical protein n=1 Tax=Jatrophihabitans sp. TaxID=1932789 RepID=UPI0030C76F1D|nr:hypothetical protein [Jatrophihabitans sp.]